MAGSVLETFYLLFQSDSKEVDEGAKKATESSDKLEKKLDKVDSQAKKAGTSFGSLAKQAAAFLLPIIGISAAKNAVLDFAASADAAGKLAYSLNMDVEALQAWQGAAVRAGGDANAFAGSVKSLNDKLLEMRLTGGGEAGMVLHHLGISARDNEGRIKSADRILLDLSGRFEGLSKQRAILLGEKLGLDEGTVALLQKGRKGVEDLISRQKELGLYTKKDAEEARKFNNTMADMGQSFRSVFAVIVRMILPVFIAISEGMTRTAVTIRKEENLVTGFFIGLSIILGILAIKAGIAFAPFFLLAAIILAVAAAFAILYDDVKAFLSGQDSLIGRLSKDYPYIAELVYDIVAVMQLLWGIVKAVGALLVEAIENPTKAWENFKEKIGPLFDAFTERFPVLGQALKDLGAIFGWLFDMAVPVLKALASFAVEILKGVVDVVSKIGGIIAKAMRWAAKKIKGEVDVSDPGGLDSPDLDNTMEVTSANIAKASQAVQIANTSISSMPPASSTMHETNKNTSVQIDRVEVHTQATDAEGISRDIGDSLDKQLQSAVDEFDDGVAA